MAAKKSLMEVIDPMGTLKFSILFVVLAIVVGALSGMLGLGAYLASPLAELGLPTVIGLLVVFVLTKVVEDKIPM